MSPQDFFYRDVSKIEEILEHSQTVQAEACPNISQALIPAPHAMSGLGFGNLQKVTYVVREVNQIYEVSALTRSLPPLVVRPTNNLLFQVDPHGCSQM